MLPLYRRQLSQRHMYGLILKKYSSILGAPKLKCEDTCLSIGEAQAKSIPVKPHILLSCSFRSSKASEKPLRKLIITHPTDRIGRSHLAETHLFGFV